MIDQLIIGGLASYDDFGASVAKSNIKRPKKKSIKETVPFSNVTYDFTAINGEIYWEQRELEYIFEMTADTPEKLEEMKSAFAGWVMNVFEEKISDPFIPDYHFKGTYEDMDFADEDGKEKTTATVKFSAYPYQIANYPKICEFSVAAGGTETVRILNASHHPITPTITASGAAVLTVGNTEYSLGAGTFKDSRLKLPAGVASVTVKSSGAACDIKIEFYEEVM